MDTKETVTIEYARLPPHVYAALEKGVGYIGVTQHTTDLQAGYQLGVQAVLRALREGYVVGV